MSKDEEPDVMREPRLAIDVTSPLTVRVPLHAIAIAIARLPVLDQAEFIGQLYEALKSYGPRVGDDEPILVEQIAALLSPNAKRFVQFLGRNA